MLTLRRRLRTAGFARALGLGDALPDAENGGSGIAFCLLYPSPAQSMTLNLCNVPYLRI